MQDDEIYSDFKETKDIQDIHGTEKSLIDCIIEDRYKEYEKKRLSREDRKSRDDKTLHCLYSPEAGPYKRYVREQLKTRVA